MLFRDNQARFIKVGNPWRRAPADRLAEDKRGWMTGSGFPGTLTCPWAPLAPSSQVPCHPSSLRLQADLH